jgi:putative glycosyltransferase (TIGR04348 family)
MRIAIATPAPRGSHNGNRVTALRWAKHLRTLGHRVRLVPSALPNGVDQEPDDDVLVALHARHSSKRIEAFHRAWPRRPILVALTGTDLYLDLSHSGEVQRSLELATRLIALQPEAPEQVPSVERGKVRVILQSACAPRVRGERRAESFDVCVVANLRDVKDPLRAAYAARLLGSGSRIRVVHIGMALDRELEVLANEEAKTNPRYHWLGGLPRRAALAEIAKSRLLVLTSRAEGGANVISEALVAGVPVVASNISGSIGLLGRDYPGLFPVGDERALAAMLARCETDSEFYDSLVERCSRLSQKLDPAIERRAWQQLLGEIAAL